MTKGSNHIVVQGQSCESIAADNGLFWEALWHHTRNAALKKRRASPHCLNPGDEIFIPAAAPKEVTVTTGQHHRFLRKGIPSKLHLVFMDGEQPYAEQPYVIEIEGESLPGRTDKNGAVIMAVPPTVGVIKLRFHNDLLARVHEFRPRTLHPASTPSGAQARLVNLGYAMKSSDSAEATPDVSIREALRMFRQDNEESSSGTPAEMDDATLSLLENRHGI